MRAIVICLFCFIFFSGCEKNESKNASMAYLLKEFQEPKESKAFYRFPIISEVLFTADHASSLNQLLVDKNNFDEFGKKCFEPEFGFKIIQPNQTIKSVLVSLECSRIYIYQNNQKIEFVLSPIGKDKFLSLYHKIFSQNEIDKVK